MTTEGSANAPDRRRGPQEISRRTLFALGGATTAGMLWPSSSYGSTVNAGSSTVTDPAGHWVHMATTEPQIFDDQLLTYFVTRSKGINYRGSLVGPAARYDYPSIVGRIKDQNDELPVLLYTQGTLLIRRPVRPESSIDQHVLAGYEDLGELLMPEWPQGENRRYWGDPRNPAFRDWLSQRILTWVDDMETDGVFVDLWRMFPALSLEPAAAIAYEDGMKQLTTEITQILGPDRLTMFNGLWYNIQPGMFEAQLEGLPLASAAMIEYYGIDPRRDRQAPVELFLPVPDEFPDKTLMFSGRGTWTYEGYEADYRRQRYTYSAYLLGAGDHAYFKYNSTFQLPGGYDDHGRTGAEAVYADWSVALGQPIGRYEDHDGLLLREFTHGLVAVNPEPAPGEPSQSRMLGLPRPMFDPEGNVFEGQVSVEPGVGLVLLDRPGRSKPPIHIDLSDANGPGGDWRWASRESGHLHLDATPAGEDWEHDLLLDNVRSLGARTRLCALIRTEDADARLRLEVEVDDTEEAHIRVVVDVGTEPTAPGTTPKAITPIPYRLSAAAAPRRGFREDWVSLAADRVIIPDAEWHAVVVDASAVVASTGRFTARRLAHVRLVGTMDVRWVRIM